MKGTDNILSHIKDLQKKLEICENNLQYIKRLQALRHWLIKFRQCPEKLSKEYAAEYKRYFYSRNGFSYFERVCNSILEYEYGNRPF